jgi:putative membrane protein (TIGR04086 family)
MSLKALFRGCIIDILISIVAPIVLGVLLALSGGRPSTTSQDAYILSSLMVGALATVAGGYVAGTTAGFRETLHGAGVGAVGLLLGVGLILLAPALFTSWFFWATSLLSVPVGALGGYLARLLRPG